MTTTYAWSAAIWRRSESVGRLLCAAARRGRARAPLRLARESGARGSRVVSAGRGDGSTAYTGSRRITTPAGSHGARRAGDEQLAARSTPVLATARLRTPRGSCTERDVAEQFFVTTTDRRDAARCFARGGRITRRGLNRLVVNYLRAVNFSGSSGHPGCTLHRSAKAAAAPASVARLDFEAMQSIEPATAQHLHRAANTPPRWAQAASVWAAARHSHERARQS